MGIVIGVIVVLGLAAFFAVLTCKSKSADLFKWIGIFLFIAFCLTWVIPTGQMNEGTFVESGLQRLGLLDLSSIAYYGVYFCLTTMLYFLTIGGFYGVLSKTKSYKNLVNKCANLVKGKEIIFTTIISLVLIVLVSLTNNIAVWFVFMPFLVSVLRNAKVDKMAIFTTTFGSVLVGVLACTYGTDSLKFFNYYMGLETSVGLKYRLAVAIVSALLYVIFNAIVLHKKVGKKSTVELKDDAFEVENAKESNGSNWLALVVLLFLVVYVFLGFFPWTTFGVEVFDKFHTWLIELGGDFPIFSYILGSSATSFGNMEITSVMTLLIVLSFVIALACRLSLKEYANSFAEGFKKILKYVIVYACCYTIFVTTYMAPIVPAIVSWFNGLTETFNPYLFSVTGLISSTFHADLGYTGYLVGSAIVSSYAEHLDLAHTLYVATYGIAQLFIPSSGLLLFGLSYLKIDYKSWFKYIWLFVVVVFAAILILATIVRYC